MSATCWTMRFRIRDRHNRRRCEKGCIRTNRETYPLERWTGRCRSVPNRGASLAWRLLGQSQFPMQTRYHGAWVGGQDENMNRIRFPILIVAAWALLAGCMPSDVSTNASDNFTEGEIAYVSTSSLNARTTPKASGKIIERLPAGTSVQIVDQSGDWVEIERRGKHLWISTRFLSATPPQTARQDAKPSSDSIEMPSRHLEETRSTRQREPSRGSAWFGRTCERGKPCGNACISQNRVCHK